MTKDAGDLFAAYMADKRANMTLEDHAREAVELEEMIASEEADYWRLLSEALQMIRDGHNRLAYVLGNRDLDCPDWRAAYDRHKEGLDRELERLPPKPKGHAPSKDDVYKEIGVEYDEAVKERRGVEVLRKYADALCVEPTSVYRGILRAKQRMSSDW
jgi:hypothetical protein